MAAPDVEPLRTLPLEALIYTAVELRIVPPKAGAVLASAVTFLDVGLPLTDEHRHRATAVLRAHGDVLMAAGLAPPADIARGPAAGPARSGASRAAARAQRRPDGMVGVYPGPYDSTVSARLRAVGGAWWDKARKQWVVPATPSAVGAVAAILPTMRCSPVIDRLLAEHLDAPITARLIDERHPVPDEDWSSWTQHAASMPPWKHQRRALPWLTAGSARLFGAQMGGGKAVDVTTPIATPSGWSTMGDLVDDDVVFDERGEPCRIVTAHPVRHDRECFEVVFSDGATIVTDGDHLWRTETRRDREHRSAHGTRDVVGGVRTTREIADTLRVGARELTNHSIVVTDPLSCEVAALPVAPYTLGVWLGDGETRGATVCTPDGPALRELLAADGYRCGRSWDRRPGMETFTVYGLADGLRAAGVLGDKRIPAAYLRASEKQRRALLAGLVDTDGTVCGHGRVQFDTTRPALADGVAELARTLGYRATVQGRRAVLDGRDYGPAWRVSFTTDDDVFALPRRREQHARRRGAVAPERNRHRYIVDVRPVESRPVRCITVDSPSRLYLAGEAMIPTHNTRVAIAGLERVAARAALLVCPAKVRGVWPRELRKWAVRDWHVVNGLEYTRTGRERARSVTDRFAEFDDTMRACQCGQPHMAILNYELLTYGEFSDWNLLRQVDDEVDDLFDVVVYDEAHRLKSMTGQASKTAFRYQPSIARRWGLTGTPLPQGVQDAGGIFRALDAGYFGSTKTAFETKHLVKGGYENKQVVGIREPDEFARRFYSCSYLPVVELDKPLPLPPVVVDVDLEPKARRIYDALDREMFAVIEAERDDAAERSVTPPNPAVKLLRLQQAAGGHVADDDGDVMIISTAKIDTLRELLCDLDEPVIVFCRFSPELDAIRALVEETHETWQTGLKRRKAKRDGDGKIMREPSTWRDGVEVPGDPIMHTVLVDDWVAPKGALRVARGRALEYREISGSRSDGLTRDSTLTPGTDVCGVQLQAGGTGIDLTGARVVIWYSPGFSVSDFDQARARVDRPGQTRNPLNIFLRATDTKDAETYDALQAGRDVVDELLHGYGLDERGGGDVRASGPMRDTSTEGEAPSVELPALPDALITRVPYLVATPDTGARGDLAGARASRRQMESIVEQRGGRRVARRGAYATADEHEAAQEALDIATGDGWNF